MNRLLGNNAHMWRKRCFDLNRHVYNYYNRWVLSTSLFCCTIAKAKPRARMYALSFLFLSQGCQLFFERRSVERPQRFILFFVLSIYFCVSDFFFLFVDLFFFPTIFPRFFDFLFSFFRLFSSYQLISFFRSFFHLSNFVFVFLTFFSFCQLIFLFLWLFSFFPPSNPPPRLIFSFCRLIFVFRTFFCFVGHVHWRYYYGATYYNYYNYFTAIDNNCQDLGHIT